MRSLSLALSFLVALLSYSLTVQADEPMAEPTTTATPASPYDKLFFAEGQLGIDGPLGIFGASVGMLPFRHLALDLGVGIGRDGYRFGGGARALFPMGHSAFGLRAGIATGPLSWSYGSYRREWDSEVFFDADISFEYRWDSGLSFRTFLGVDQALGNSNPRCVSNSANVAAPATCVNEHPARPYLGVTLGYAFGGENARI